MKAAMDLSDKVKNEQFREYCYIGDLDLVKNFYRQEAPDVNSQNKMNGWYLCIFFFKLDSKLYKSTHFVRCLKDCPSLGCKAKPCARG